MQRLWKAITRRKGVLGGLASVLLLAAAFRVINERAFFAQASM